MTRASTIETTPAPPVANEPSVTIVVVPRERFSGALRSLASIYEHTDSPFSLVYVDGGSPARVRDHLRAEARRRGFQLIRSRRYLSPNRARNLGLAGARGTYVVFVDNDVLVAPGWLAALVRCAEETSAWLVGPLYLQGDPADGIIHMAGGTLHVEERPRGRVLYATHHHAGMRTIDVPELARSPSDLVEFHTMLARREVFDRLGPLDEGLLNTREHVDLCLAVGRAGGSVYFEPAAVVSYLPPPSLEWSDLPYFMRRWSKRWSRASLRHFSAKWALDSGERHLAFLTRHRRLVWRPLRQRIGRLLAALVPGRRKSDLAPRGESRYVRSREGTIP